MQFLRSITDIDFYKKVYKQPFIRSFLYFFLLGTLIYVIMTASDTAIVSKQVVPGLIDAVHRFPDFSLEEGILTTDSDEPIVIDNNNAYGMVIIIDTANKTSTDAIKNALVQGILVYSDRIFLYQGGALRELPFEILKGVIVNKELVINFLPRLPMLIAVLSPCWFPIWLAGKFIGILVLSAIGLVIVDSKKLHSRFNFPVLMNLSVYAITLSWLFKIANRICLSWLNIGIPEGPIPLQFLVYWGIAVIYLMKAIDAVNADMMSNEKFIV